jgi:hypothetical protein
VPWLEDIVTLLEDAGVGTFGASLFASTKAKVPLLTGGQATCTIVETGGTSPESTHTTRTSQTTTEVVTTPAYLRPSAQLTFKADEYAEARAMAGEAYDALAGVRNTFVNSGWYRSIVPLQEPFDGGLDARGQAQVKFNILGDKRPRRSIA